LTTSIRFSVLGDQLGQERETYHNKSSGGFGADLTGRTTVVPLPIHDCDFNLFGTPTDRKYAQRFDAGILRARDKYHKIFNHRISGEGVTAHYYCSSQQTVNVIRKWEEHLGVSFSEKETAKRVGVLRRDWLEFMKDPTAYVDNMREVVCVMPLVTSSCPTCIH
jgi:hypothetical protein